MPIRRPDHGCHGYSSSRNSVLWAFSSLVVQRGATSQRDRQQSPDRADRSVSGMRPALTGTGWKKASRPVQGWGAVQLMSKTYLKSDHCNGGGSESTSWQSFSRCLSKFVREQVLNIFRKGDPN